LTVLIDIGSGIFGRLFSEARPIDWLIVAIDFLVLLWIAADIVKIPHRWKRRSAVNHIVALLADGESLLSARPTAQATNDAATAWVESVKSWIVAVHSLLAKDALRALAVFGHWPVGPRSEIEVHSLAEPWFLELDARLSALRSIMEKPEIYF
jgi:hypothetical protein